jgi:type II secretory pathway predicted ATPase ExeA
MPFGGRVLRPLPGGQEAQSLAPASSAGLFSLTYEPYYGLKEKAFSLSADPKFLFRSPEHAPAFDELLNGIRRREGLITLTGEIGTGKTTLIRSVLQHLDRRTFSAFVPDPFVSREDLLKMLLVDFGVVSIADLKRGGLSGTSRPDLSYPLYEFLDSLVPLQAFAVLIIDEAQNLPLPLLEEIRILSDLEGREKLLQVVLVGQPELRAHLKLPEMRQVNQRVSVRCELTPLTREGIAGYIDHRLRVASDGQANVEFPAETIDAVFDASGGTPRVINLICDRALYRGFNARVGRIEPHFVWDAITDLGLEISRPDPAAPQPSQAATAATSIAEVKPVAEPKRTAEQLFPVAAAQVQKRSAIPVVPPPRELLSDFAPERDVKSSSESAGIARGWRLVGAAMFLALLATGGMFAYVQLQAATNPPALRFPPPPAKVIGTLPPIVPHFGVQVATFQTLGRAQRLAQQLTNGGYPSIAIERSLGPAGSIFEVLMGDYPTELDAARDLAALQSQSQQRFPDARIEPFTSVSTR